METAQTPSAPEIVVIGAGGAGIAAAHRLQAFGFSVLVVEASDRIGGRAFTESETFGFPFDHGCAWLQGPGNLPYISAARSAGFTLIDHDDPPGALFSGGTRATPDDVARYDQAASRLRQLLASHADDVAASSLVNSGDRWLAAAATWLSAMDHGVDLTELSSADVAVYGAYAVNALVREGLGSLVEQFATGLPVQTGTVVTGIDWSGTGATVRTQKGDIRSQAVIVTVSTGVMSARSIRFTPDLPADVWQAFDDLPMGLLTKIALQTDGARFGLPENAFVTRAVDEPLPAKAAFFLSFPAGYDLCVGFVGGSRAWEIEKAGEDAAIAFATEQLASILGSDIRRHIRKGRMTNWGSNPWTRGAYAAARPGRHKARAVLSNPLGDRVFFAGEALGGAYPALLSGAHISGDAAARRVANILAAKTS
ncbi:NAD(P)/FAD-dependent oxidoreductase [Hyphomonas sp.]|uniref:flavin monoamine oxidase family protein n=1 Tax=Hyphomonas sp. TaxID=87 RepID=UPI0025B97B0A|nr:NAD(P)/FAD-dependent oxidoreductase [Hyphomonas sp.]MBI1399007.1 NAD(P)-binding protein [Hyphomonas sp.]